MGEWLLNNWQLVAGVLGGAGGGGILARAWDRYYKTQRDVLSDHDDIGKRWKDEAQEAWQRVDEMSARVDKLLAELRQEREAKHDALRYAKDMEALYDTARVQLTQLRADEQATAREVGQLKQRLTLVEAELEQHGLGSISDLLERRAQNEH